MEGHLLSAFPFPAPCVGSLSGTGGWKMKGRFGVTSWVGWWVPPAARCDVLFGDGCTAFSLLFGDEGAVGMVVGIMASCFLSMDRWLLCALAERKCCSSSPILPVLVPIQKPAYICIYLKRRKLWCFT